MEGKVQLNHQKLLIHQNKEHEETFKWKMLLKIGCKDIIKKYLGQIEIKNKINYIRYYAISPRKLFVIATSN